MSNVAIILDASAVLALLHREPGHQVVTQYLAHSAISTVNLAEVIGKQQEIGMPSAQLVAHLKLLGVAFIDLDAALAAEIGQMRSSAKRYGLSLGDLACLALGKHRGCPVLTADRLWSQTDYGVEVILIR